ncbi:hypothetical protein QUA56_26120 [Microcoleus sp. N3A4]|uniref:hypothetical protein n=1 Tax=Microcoleus sp. N3A4 TaxID=3055379 RepID=UPI002FD1091F
MTERESFNHNAVEVDGIRFETIVPNRVLSVPVKKSNSDGYTSVELGMKITNGTPIPLYREWIYNINSRTSGTGWQNQRVG